MKPQTALVLGATGFIGSNVLTQLLADDDFEKVIVLVRKNINLTHPKLQVEIIDFNNTDDFKGKITKGDCIFCCVGTTMKNVKGDKEAYRKIDHDIAVHAAEYALDAGYSKYLLVSSVGANESSNNFYLKLKGEVENAISNFSFKAFHIFQPSILLGKRNERRPAEAIAQSIMEASSALFFGSFSKYKAIHATTVAKAMIAASKQKSAGKFVYTFKEIKKLSGG